MSTTLSTEPGAISRLLTAYMALRGVSKRRLAKLVDTVVERVRSLSNGGRTNRHLGLIARGRHEPLLVSVGRVLEIPYDELAAAVMADVGFDSPVSSGAPYPGGEAQWWEVSGAPAA
jgi:hypothetical protein